MVYPIKFIVMRKISIVKPVYFGSIPYDPTDRECVPNIYITVVQTPFKDKFGNDCVRLSDEMALFCRFYSSNLNTDTMANFYKSLEANKINLPDKDIPSAFQFCRSRYCQSPSEMQSFLDSLSSTGSELSAGLNDRVAYLNEKYKKEHEPKNEPPKNE